MSAAWQRCVEAVAARCDRRAAARAALAEAFAGWEAPEHRLAEACWRAGRDRLRRRFGAAVDAFGLGLVRVEAGGESWQPADLRHGVRDGLAAVTLPVVVWERVEALGGGWAAATVDLVAWPAAGRPLRLTGLADAVPGAGLGVRVFASLDGWLAAWRQVRSRAFNRAVAAACCGHDEAAAIAALGAVERQGPFVRGGTPAASPGLLPLVAREKLGWLDALGDADRVLVDEGELGEWLEKRLKAERRRRWGALPDVLVARSGR